MNDVAAKKSVPITDRLSPDQVGNANFVLGFVRGCVRSALSAKDAAARQWNLEQAEELLAAHDAFLSGGAP